MKAKSKGGFITLIDDDCYYNYHELFYYNNGISCKTIKIKLKRIKNQSYQYK